MDRERLVPIVSYAVGGQRRSTISDSDRTGARILRHPASAVAVASVVALGALYYAWPNANSVPETEDVRTAAGTERSTERARPGFSITSGTRDAPETPSPAPLDEEGRPAVEDLASLPYAGVVQLHAPAGERAPRGTAPSIAKASSLPPSYVSGDLISPEQSPGAPVNDVSPVCDAECVENGGLVAAAEPLSRTQESPVEVAAQPGGLSNEASSNVDVRMDSQAGVLVEQSTQFIGPVPSGETAPDASPALTERSQLSSLPSAEDERLVSAGEVDGRDGIMLGQAEGLVHDDAQASPILAADSEREVREVIAEHLERVEQRYSSAAPIQETLGERDRVSAASLAASKETDHVGVVVPVDEARGFSGIVLEDELVAIQLNDLVSLFEDRMERPLYVWLRSSSSGSNYVTSETLKAAGIDARYDPDKKQIVFSLIDSKR